MSGQNNLGLATRNSAAEQVSQGELAAWGQRRLRFIEQIECWAFTGEPLFHQRQRSFTVRAIDKRPQLALGIWYRVGDHIEIVG